MGRDEDEGRLTLSLELLAEQIGDPSDKIYDRLFDSDPRFRDLFFLDPNGDVRGEMLSQAFDVLMRADRGDPMADILLKANRFAHDGYGVAPEEFHAFFGILRSVTKEELGPEWTQAMERRWDDVLAGLMADD